MIPWGLALVDLDLDGRDDYLVTHGNDAAAWFDARRRNLLQQAVAWWNAGDFCFADVSAALHVDTPGQFRSLSIGDLDGNGAVDVAVGGQGSLPAVYRNDVDAGNFGFALRLRGTTSNLYGI